MIFELTPERWAEQQFGTCNLGDRRRTARAVAYATAAARSPDASTPDQTEGWSDCKAAYRLFNQPDVTFAALAGPHWQQTRALAKGHVLVIDDTTETNYGRHRVIRGLGPTGTGRQQGFLLHSAVMIGADDGQIVGLAGQELFYRRPVPPDENAVQRKRRPRESEVWGRLVDAVGPAGEATRYTHVMDRAADNWELFVHLVEQRSDWIVRASSLHRRVWHATLGRVPLEQALAAATTLGEYDLEVRAMKQQPPRTARIVVSVTRIEMPAPRIVAPVYRPRRDVVISQYVIEAREIDPPKKAPAVRWVLYTSHPVESFADAWRVLGWYEKRWTIEEFHKCLKSGCSLEQRQYGTAAALEAVVGMFSVLAVRLLQLRSLARATPQRPAAEVVPARWLHFYQRLRPKIPVRTVREFVRAIARLGGFLARKGDREPGWQTLWRGFQRFLTLLEAADLLRPEKCG